MRAGMDLTIESLEALARAMGITADAPSATGQVERQ